MDVSDAAIREAFRLHGVSRMIHGHTHRPADHDYDIDGRRCVRHVLADWHPGRCEALRVDAGGVTRVPIEG
jgi:UDP-2,3-diacylglucosamine hydrolase